MVTHEFTSNFAARIQGFILQKHALGHPYGMNTLLLWQFDKMCRERFPMESRLTKDICMAWAVRKASESNNSFRRRLGPLREFARYLNRAGETAFVLPLDFARKGPRYVPHIYTEAEIASIWRVADEIEQKRADSPVRHLVIPTFLRLLYCCGLRPGEARNLRLENVDLERGRLEIMESKGLKNRHVWMADDMAERCRNYNSQVERIIPKREVFFPNNKGQVYGTSYIDTTFRNIRAKAGIQQAGEHPPRLYDFRHTFATHRLYQWMREGKDISAVLPYLSVYMGHSQISDTHYYIHLVPGMVETMSGVDFSAFSDLLPEVESDE